MTDTDALTSLRSSVAQFDREEKLALVGFLALECTPRFGWAVFQEREPFSETLENAFEASTSFSLTEKLSFAIELLQHCQDEEEAADGIDSKDDYDPREDGILDVEHFRDRRLDH